MWDWRFSSSFFWITWLHSSSVLIILFSLFCATGITESISSNACSSALRKLCEDALAIIHDPQNLEILIWIGEVIVLLIPLKSLLHKAWWVLWNLHRPIECFKLEQMVMVLLFLICSQVTIDIYFCPHN